MTRKNHDEDEDKSDIPPSSVPLAGAGTPRTPGISVRPSRAPTTANGIAIGDVLAGHYLIEGVLDEGGMAVVYSARNTGTGKACAIKVLHAQLGNQPDIVKLFAKEARVGAVIGDSDNIVQVFDAGIDEATRVPFIVMELLDGETLERALERGPMTRQETRIILRQLGEALDQAHAAGVVHRDLKPSNLFLTRDPQGNPVVKVMDFGIAKVLEEGAVRTATQIGTPAYTAPEQMGATTRKLAAKQGITIAKGISPATDVWALGLIAYELFTGQRPGHYWGIETVNELPMKVAFEELEPASKRADDKAELLPEGFDAWFARCMRKNAKERWQSAGEAIRQLLALEQGIGAEEEDVIELVEAPKARKSLAPPELPNDKPKSEVPTPRSSRPQLLSENLPTLPRTPPQLVTIPGAPTIFEDTELPKKNGNGSKVVEAAPASPRDPSRLARTQPALSASWKGKTANDASHRLLGAVFGMVVLGAAGGALWLTPKGDSASLCLTPKAGMEASETAARCDQACTSGSLASCAKLAAMHVRGGGVAKDEARARALLARACGVNSIPSTLGNAAASRWLDEVARAGCEQGSCVARSCADLAGYYQDGRGGVSKQPEIAAALFKRVCQVDYGPDTRARGLDGCVGLGAQRERAGQGDAARAYYRAACDGGVIAGCVALANQAERDLEPKTRMEKLKNARALYQRACDGGDLDGCARLGRMVEHGRGGWERDVPQAVALYKKACEGGAAIGCVALASAYSGGRGGLTRDAVKAAELLKHACDIGQQEGCAHYANMVAAGEAGLTKDGKRAFALNQDACEGGALLGCANLGKMYLEGQAGLTKDESEARKLFGRACDGGEAVGCMHLAELETKKAEPQSAGIEALYGKACDAGAPDGCVKLGTLLEVGEAGFTKDLARAAELYRRGCDDGSMRGCTQLANFAYNGEGGLNRDLQKSVELNDKACKGGEAAGCIRLGLLYARGEGVTKDHARAQELFKSNCTSASEENKDRCSSLQKLLTTPEPAPSATASAG
jgi:TPR repeat protein/serine/threonine protein kinase